MTTVVYPRARQLRRYLRDLEPFILGTTRPGVFIEGTAGRTKPGPYVGIDSTLGTLTPYTGPSAGGTLLLTTSNQVFEGVDFAATNTKVKRQANDIQFRYCRFGSSTADATWNGTPLIECRTGAKYGGLYLYRCELTSITQFGAGTVGIMGDGFTIERSVVHNLGDCVQSYGPTDGIAGTPLNVEILGNWLGDLAFHWAPTKGIVHPSDTNNHSDAVQWQGGLGLNVQGNDIQAHYSETIGTGTPNSGNDTASLANDRSVIPYTQAEAEAKRQEIMYGSGSFPSGLGGDISGVMFSPSQRGYIPKATIINNWGSGGSIWLNAGNDSLIPDPDSTYTLEIKNNILSRNQRNADWGIGIDSDVTALLENNYWEGTSTLVPRKNG